MRLQAPDYVVLVVSDLDQSVTFYRDVLGLTLGHRSGPYAQFDTGPTRVSLYQRDAMAETIGAGALRPPPPDAPGFELGFKVGDVDAAYAELVERGAQPQTPPTDRPWGQRTAYLRDPDGHLVELATQLERPPGTG